MIDSALLGWDPTGYGSVVKYPMAYIVYAPIHLLGLLQPLWSLRLTFALILLILYIALLRCVQHMGMQRGFSLLSFAFFALSPWTYNEIVAGHILMLVSVAGILGIVGETVALRPDPRITLLFFLCTLHQAQFALISTLLILAKPQVRFPRWIMLALLAPALVGYLANRTSLVQIPLLTSWEANQSVHVPWAFIFSGYFAGYDRPLLGTGYVDALGSLVICGVVGLFIGIRERRIPYAIPILASFMLLFALGGNGPLGSIVISAFEHIPESGVFRELYDFVSFADIACAIGLLVLISKWRHVTPFIACLTLVMLRSWLIHPPEEWWVRESSIPMISWHAGQGDGRVALFPFLQPMGLGNSGSGMDPDAYQLTHPSLNEYYPGYPVSSAFAAAEYGDSSLLRSLSVSKIVQRPYLRSDINSIAYTRFMDPRNSTIRNSSLTPLVPMYSAWPMPDVQPTFGALSDGNILAIDSSQLGKNTEPLFVLHGTRKTLDARQEWVDERFVETTFPEFANALGGKFTVSRRSMHIEGGNAYLMRIEGVLEVFSPHATVIQQIRSPAFSWITLDRKASSVRCFGRCLLVASADRPILRGVRRHRFQKISGRQLTPFFLQVSPSTTFPVIRLNERFDFGWIALQNAQILRHFRMDGIANAWISADHGTIYLVHITSAVQLLLAMIAALWSLFFIVRYRALPNAC